MIKRFVIASINFYRNFLSPLKPQTCRFYPTCSNYARDAVQRHGVAAGLWLTIKRLSRCHPWHPGGYDPID